MKKSLFTGIGILVAAAIISVYLLGLHHGRTGEGLTIIKEAAAAADKKPMISMTNPTSAL